MKKCVIFVALAFIILSSFALATNIDIAYPTKVASPEGDVVFSAGESIVFQINLYDDNTKPITDKVKVIIEDGGKTIIPIEQEVQSNEVISINLGDKARNGLWAITAEYAGIKATNFFTISTNELASFELNGDELTITNTGNTRYLKTIQIIIGETIGTKDVDLDIGEKTALRLIAPDGTYNVKITIDGKSQLERSNVILSGNAIGILDEKLITGGNPLTSIRAEEDSGSFYSFLKNQKFAYVFLLTIVGAGILLAIERNYRKKV